MIVIVDIDGTLSNCTHRLHNINPPTNSKKNWSEFFSCMDKDTIFHHTRVVVNALKEVGHTIVLLTGRPENYRNKTVDWIVETDVQFDVLLMRPKGDHHSDVIVKKDLLLGFLSEKGLQVSDILCAFEDRDRIIDLWKSMGIPVFEHRPYEGAKSEG